MVLQHMASVRRAVGQLACFETLRSLLHVRRCRRRPLVAVL